jgi:hypothetical protein
MSSRSSGSGGSWLDAGLFARDGPTHEEWLVVDGLDAVEWTARTKEALA